MKDSEPDRLGEWQISLPEVVASSSVHLNVSVTKQEADSSSKEGQTDFKSTTGESL